MVRNGGRAAAVGAWIALFLAVGASLAAAADAALPDGRRYELVSPAVKNGVEVIPMTDKHHVSPDGNAVTFAALGGFGDVEGSSFDFEFMSRRTGLAGTNGWATHGINPLERSTTLDAAITGNSSTFVDGFTPDLSTGIYRTWRPLVAAPNVPDVSNLYRITGLSGGSRTVQLMTDAINALPASWFAFMNGAFVRMIKPQFAGASSDLRHVVFESQLQLTADAPSYQGFCAFFGLGCPTQLYENADGVVRLVGRIPQAPDVACDDAEGPACVAGNSSQAAISASARFYSQLAVATDGRRIYFQEPADVPEGAIYVREDGVRTERLATNGQFWGASADGARAVFTTSDSLLASDTDSNPDVYMYDRSAPAGARLTLISASNAGTDGYVETVLGISADGQSVFFVCDGQLIAGEPPATIMGLYVWRDGQLRFIGTFQDINEASANGPRNDWSFIATARKARIAPNGRYLLFATTSDSGFAGRGAFAGYDQANHREFYVYDAATGRLVCASCNPSGRAATADALIDVRDNAATAFNTSDTAQALTDDGQRVFFNTAEPLVPEDINGRPDAYEYDLQTARVHLLSSGTSPAPSYFLDATPSGNDVFIVTRQRLVGWDIDESYDLYDARVGGGLPEPLTPAPACAGEGCRAQSSTPPVTNLVTSLSAKGVGNAGHRLKRHRKCGRKSVFRKVRGKTRCVRRRSHRRLRRAGMRSERGTR